MATMIDTSQDDLAPPSDSVWTKYSPNHEFPMASTVSILVHGLLLALAIVGGLAFNNRLHSEAGQAPKMDVAFVANANGTPDAGGDGPSGNSAKGTEFTETKQAPKDPLDTTNLAPPMLDPIMPRPLEANSDIAINIPSANPPDMKNAFDTLQRDLKIADAKQSSGPGGFGGTGTGVGGGNGTGKGIGNGPGTKPGNAGTPSRAEVLAQRWRFNPSGSPREHVEKLIAAGVRVGFKDGADQFYLIADLKKRPVNYQLEPFEKYKDTVKWFSQDPRSVLGMAVELQLPGPPQFFVLLLPKEREQKLAEAEFQYARTKNRDLKGVQETWFDFQAVGGAFVPAVAAQVPFDPRPKW